MIPDTDPFLLFVYGTLKRGGVRLAPLAGRPFLGAARTLPRYALHDLGAYPGLVDEGADGRSVEGELYEPPKHWWTLMARPETGSVGLVCWRGLPISGLGGSVAR